MGSRRNLNYCLAKRKEERYLVRFTTPQSSDQIEMLLSPAHTSRRRMPCGSISIIANSQFVWLSVQTPHTHRFVSLIFCNTISLQTLLKCLWTPIMFTNTGGMLSDCHLERERALFPLELIKQMY